MSQQGQSGLGIWNMENLADLVALAQRCEAACSRTTQWSPQEFFRFDTDEELAPETERVAGLLRNAPNTNAFTEFFAEAKTYLHAARAGRQDMSDSARMSALANAMLASFAPLGFAPAPPITL